jgi:hypothetical protein
LSNTFSNPKSLPPRKCITRAASNFSDGSCRRQNALLKKFSCFVRQNIIDTISLSKNQLRRGGGSASLLIYVKKADDPAYAGQALPTKLTKDRGRIPQWRIADQHYLTCNYRLQGGNLQANWRDETRDNRNYAFTALQMPLT